MADNLAVFGSMNANRRRCYRTDGVLAWADRGWLGQLVTRGGALDNVTDALRRSSNDIKVVLGCAGG